MKILDLDMDYFMTKVANGVGESVTSRLIDEEFEQSVWCKDDVIRFLEDKLGLSKEAKIPGRIVSGHNEALYFWKELMLDGKLSVPFEVVHIDSHADLGLGTDSAAYISRELLKWPVTDRPEHSRHVNCFGHECSEGIADYLLYALAYRWISRLTYCGNPNGESNDYDISVMKDLKEQFIWNDPVDNVIQLIYNPNMSCPNPYTDDPEDVQAYLDSGIKEPEVPFTIIPTIEGVNYCGDFDFVLLAQSPNYTPESADFIMDVFHEYIQEI